MTFTFHMRLDRERETEADLALQKRDHLAINCLPTSTMTLGPAIILLLFTPFLQAGNLGEFKCVEFSPSNIKVVNESHISVPCKTPEIVYNHTNLKNVTLEDNDRILGFTTTGIRLGITMRIITLMPPCTSHRDLYIRLEFLDRQYADSQFFDYTADRSLCKDGTYNNPTERTHTTATTTTATTNENLIGGGVSVILILLFTKYLIRHLQTRKKLQGKLEAIYIYSSAAGRVTTPTQ